MTDARATELRSPFEVNPEAWLAAIVDSSDDAVVGKTLDSVIRSWNAGAQRMFGYTADEIVGRTIYTLIPPELQHEETEIVARLVRGERIEHFETVRVRKDGSRIEVSISVSPIRDETGIVIGAAKIARDISEAKLLQRRVQEASEKFARALADAQDAKQEAERANAAKSQFLAVMSHELRTPLNAIAGYVDLLETGVRGELTQPQRNDLARIKRSGETLLRLIDDVLSFAKLESGRLEYHFTDERINTLLASLESFVAPRLVKKGLSYDLDPCGSDVTVSIDRDKVEQILLNLLSNAVKFTETGGIQVRCSADDRKVWVHVQDTGSGIRPELLESIFEPFVQGDRSLTRTAEGTGLGLSISRELARMMGGDVTVESTPGVGTTFTLALPRTSL